MFYSTREHVRDYVRHAVWWGLTNRALDRFHIRKQLGQNQRRRRAAEANRLRSDGHEPLLTHSRPCLLKQPENLTDRQILKLDELLKYI